MTPTPDELAPSPPGVEVCSCDEALALRAEVARLNEALAAAEREETQGIADYLALQDERDRQVVRAEASEFARRTAEAATARLRARVAFALVNDESTEDLAARIREVILRG